MTARGAILTPFTRTPARQEAGPDGVKLWWKRLLPVGEVKYQDRILKFTKSYNDSLVKAYQDGAYDQVPLQLADEKNTHTNDPERFRGDVVAMRSTSDGLWVGVLPTDRGDNVLAENPRLGVSARIVEGYDRSDGKFYPAAIQHVLGTLDPRIPQLGAWRAVSLSNEHVTTIDLTGESFMNGETITMPELSAEHSAKLARLLDLPEAQFSALVSGLQVPELTDDEIRQLAGEYDGGELSDEELAAMVAGLTDDELAAIEAEFEGELAGSASAAGLSNEVFGGACGRWAPPPPGCPTRPRWPWRWPTTARSRRRPSWPRSWPATTPPTSSWRSARSSTTSGWPRPSWTAPGLSWRAQGTSWTSPTGLRSTRAW
jgi:hypothetical protein